MKVSWQQHSLAFRYPFTISKGTKTHQPTLTVALSHLGVTGYGEAPAITYYNVTTESMAAVLQAKQMFVEKYAFNGPDRYWHYLHHLLPNQNFLICALDIAAWDIQGKLQGKPLYKVWNTELNPNMQTDYTIGIDTTEKMIEKMQEKPWPIYKIKVGTDRDIEIIEAMRKHTDGPIRVDANAAWTKEAALENIIAFEKLGVEYVEQPLAKDDWEGMQWLYERSPLPLFADEACVLEADVDKCAPCFHGINIKLTKCSGITPALRMIQNARSKNLKIMLGCMNESTIGSAAMAHLSPQVDYLDMDGPLLLSEDLATGITYDYGKFNLPDRAGLGIQLIDKQ
jgi:L-Ala-D/L-Glu epimerase